MAVFSPDGKWLAFLSDESGEAEIYVQAIDRRDDSLRVTGERFPISRQGAQCLRWPKDARELYYRGFDGKVCAVPLAFRPAAVHAWKPEALFTIDAEATPRVDQVGQHDAYGEFADVTCNIPADSAQLLKIELISPNQPLYQALRSVFAQTASVEGARLGNTQIEGIFINDAYLYQMR